MQKNKKVFLNKFYKYYANGNDFIVFNAKEKKDRSKMAQELCNRYSGIGADGMIVLLEHEKYDFEWEFYNCDGSTASMCGNGSRAAAHFAHHFNKISKNMSFLTGAGVIEACVQNDEVEVVLTRAKPPEKAFEFEGLTWQKCDTGVPHLVHFCKDLQSFDLKLCKILRQKYNANVNFAQIVDENFLKVRTFERGVEAETLACGTGMAACFYLAFLEHKLKNAVKVMPSSNEEVFLKFEDEKIFFKAMVRFCFEANYHFI